MNGRRVPVAYLAMLGGLLLFGGFTALVYFGVPPFDTLALFILGQLAAAFVLLVFGVLGGAFVGMLLAHRMFSKTEFTPFERTLLESLAEVKGRLTEVQERLARLEDPGERRLRP